MGGGVEIGETDIGSWGGERERLRLGKRVERGRA